MSKLNKELIEAYKHTNYHVNSEFPFILNIEKPSIQLLNLYKKHEVLSAAFITAWNPFSKMLSREQNVKRNCMLLKELLSLKLEVVDGYGQDSKNEWPKEDSYLALGISRISAMAIANRYEQNAIVWCDSNAIPKLILLD